MGARERRVDLALGRAEKLRDRRGVVGGIEARAWHGGETTRAGGNLGPTWG